MNVRTIAYLGPPGTWSEVAARQWGDAQAIFLPVPSMAAVVQAIKQGAADYGVLPIENSIAGAVGTTLALLTGETELTVRAEVVVPIRHVLVAQLDAVWAQIVRVQSHPQALAQCRQWLQRMLPQAQTMETVSTTAAVQAVLLDPKSAAIASPSAAAQYPVQVLAQDIQDVPTNATRFVVLAHDV